MEYDNEALEAKKREIALLIRGAVPPSTSDPDRIAESLAAKFVELTPPTKPEVFFQMLTAQSTGSGGGQSRKPGNICLNWRKLMDLVPDVTIAVAGGTTAPRWLLPLIGLYVWNRLWCSSEERLTETEAVVICTLWKNRNGDNKISEDIGFERTNQDRKAMSLAPLSKKEYDAAINRLLKMKCIEMDSGVIWLREWVRVKY